MLSHCEPNILHQAFGLHSSCLGVPWSGPAKTTEKPTRLEVAAQQCSGPTAHTASMVQLCRCADLRDPRTQRWGMSFPRVRPLGVRVKLAVRPSPGWRNWQTQRTQNPPIFGSWGFDPPSRHQQTKELHRVRDHGRRSAHQGSPAIGTTIHQEPTLRAENWLGCFGRFQRLIGFLQTRIVKTSRP